MTEMLTHESEIDNAEATEQVETEAVETRTLAGEWPEGLEIRFTATEWIKNGGYVTGTVTKGLVEYVTVMVNRYSNGSYREPARTKEVAVRPTSIEPYDEWPTNAPTGSPNAPRQKLVAMADIVKIVEEVKAELLTPLEAAEQIIELTK